MHYAKFMSGTRLPAAMICLLVPICYFFYMQQLSNDILELNKKLEEELTSINGRRAFDERTSAEMNSIRIKENIGDYNIKAIRKLPIIFVSGHMRSGTTLMRSILEVHPSIFCGPETKVFPSILRQLINIERLAIEKNWEKSFFFNFESLYDATALYMYHIFKSNPKSSEIFCAKDPYIFVDVLYKLFPNAKFLNMIRDGRAVCYSLIKKQGVDLTEEKFYEYLKEWNRFNRQGLAECERVGRDVCRFLRYEDLIREPEKNIKEVARFLNITYTPEFLNHQKHIGEEIQLEINAWSSNQVKKPLYNESMTPWIGKVKYDKKLVSKTITMLEEFGYKIDFDNEQDGQIVEDSDEIEMKKKIQALTGNKKSSSKKNDSKAPK